MASTPSNRPRGGIKKYSPSVAKKIVEYAALGLPRKDISALIGINEGTLYEWFNKYPDLYEKVQAADAQNILDACDIVKQDMRTNMDGKLAMRWLAARRGAEFGQKTRVDVANADDKPFAVVEAEVGKLTKEQLEALLAATEPDTDNEDQ